MNKPLSPHPANPTDGPSSVSKKAEAALDSLLAVSREEAVGRVVPARQSSRERFRDLVQSELRPEMEELRRKYAAFGVTLEWDFDTFLSGGSRITLELAYEGHGLILRGMVTDREIAFSQIHCQGGLESKIASGALHSLRKLDRKAWREIVCDKLAEVVRMGLRDKRRAGH